MIYFEVSDFESDIAVSVGPDSGLRSFVGIRPWG